jgi:hypothetical protein
MQPVRESENAARRMAAMADFMVSILVGVYGLIPPPSPRFP